MAGGDRGLELVRAGLPAAQRRLDLGHPGRDVVVAPTGAVLVGQGNEVAGVTDPGRSAGVGEHDQGVQPEHLGLVGHQVDEQARPAAPPRRTAPRARGRHRPTRCGPSVNSRCTVASTAGSRSGQLVGGRHLVRDGVVGEAALGAHEALRHRRLGDEEQPGHLRRRQPAQRPQRQRHPALDRQHRVARREHQRSRSSRTTCGSGSSHPSRAARPRWAARCLSSRLASRRSRSIALLRAMVVIHAPGWSGIPSSATARARPRTRPAPPPRRGRGRRGGG